MHAHTHVVWRIRFFHGGSDSGSRLDSPSTLTSRLLCCLWIYFSPQLNSLNSKSPHPSITSLPPRPQALHLPPANKGGQIQYGFNKEGEKKKRDRQTQRRETERSRERSSDVFLTFSFPPFLLRSLSVSLPAWLVKVSAARRASLFWQPSNSRLSTLLSPCKREKEGRTNIVTARLYCKVVDTDVL